MIQINKSRSHRVYLHIFTYIHHKNQPNVGKYTIHGPYGECNTWILNRPGRFKLQTIDMDESHPARWDDFLFTTCHSTSLWYDIPLRQIIIRILYTLIFFMHKNGSTTWYRNPPSIQKDESYHAVFRVQICWTRLPVPGRKGARSAGCWDPENLVKLEEWGEGKGRWLVKLPSLKLTVRPWKIPIFPGKYHQNDGFSSQLC